MLDFKTALGRALDDISPVSTERIAVATALGRVLRKPLLAMSPIPRFDTSAMDGYALQATGCVPEVDIAVIGEARTGGVPGELAQGSSMRIFTGAAVPWALTQ